MLSLYCRFVFFTPETSLVDPLLYTCIFKHLVVTIPMLLPLNGSLLLRRHFACPGVLDVNFVTAGARAPIAAKGPANRAVTFSSYTPVNMGVNAIGAHFAHRKALGLPDILDDLY